MNKTKFNLQLFALPEDTEMKFPPMGNVSTLYSVHSAWYSGDTYTLGAIHENFPSSVGVPQGAFWSKKPEEGTMKVHIPVASDISSVSSDLLFAEMPDVDIPASNGEEQSPEEVQAQERLDEIIQLGGVAGRLLESAESASAMGGVFLKPTWDKSVADFPILSIAQADNAIPEFKWGILVAVTFWRILDKRDNGDTIRHLERHERGKIFNGVYVGNKDKLGRRVSLDYHPSTKNLEDEINTRWDDLMVRYVPNIRPNRLFRGSALGQSDYAGIEGLMNALDETYSSWMRDIRLARARVIVPESFLEYDDERGPQFDVDKSVFTPISADPLTSENAGITSIQFDIRASKHMESAYELLERIVTHAGFSPQTFGLKVEGRSESGTALNVRERKTYTTRHKKWKYWKSALEDIFEMMLFIDREHLGNRTQVMKPSVKLADTLSRDMASVATSIQTLNNAQAVSIDTKVRMLHQDWTEEQIEAEVNRIMEEQGLSMPNPDDIGIS